MMALRIGRGQAMVEFALMVPILILIMMGTIDLGRVYYLNIAVVGASRAGVRVGVTSDTADIGDFLRSEPNTAITNTAATWGATGPGGVRAQCVNAPASQACGDPNGCVQSSFTSGQLACFAIRTCILSPGPDVGTCAGYGPWGSRPEPGGGANGLQVVVVYRFTGVTPVISQVAAVTGNGLQLTGTTVGDQIYY